MTWVEAVFREAEGWVRVSVKARDPGRFVDLCQRLGIDLWDVEAGPDGRSITCSLRLGDVKKLAAARRQSRFSFRVLQRRGLPFLAGRVRARPAFIAGAFFFGIVLCGFLQFIWQVDVLGAENLDRNAILRTAEEAGLYPGALKPKLDAGEVAEAVVKAHENISWATVRVRGVRAVLEVIEKTLPPAPDFESPRSEVVAGRAGIIVSAVALEGRALVKPRDTVAEGDLLIALEDGSGTAEGIVIARTWREAESSCPLTKRVMRPTGSVARAASVSWRGSEILRWGPKAAPFEAYWAVERRFAVPWRNPFGAVEVKLTVYEEAVWLEEELGFRRAKEEALNSALAGILKDTPSGAERASIIGESFREPDGVRARVVVETLEDIGVAVPREFP